MMTPENFQVAPCRKSHRDGNHFNFCSDSQTLRGASLLCLSATHASLCTPLAFWAVTLSSTPAGGLGSCSPTTQNTGMFHWTPHPGGNMSPRGLYYSSWNLIKSRSICPPEPSSGTWVGFLAVGGTHNTQSLAPVTT